MPGESVNGPTPAPGPDDILALVANDQEWAARSLESILVPEGYRVDRVYTGMQALRRALERSPDIVILDSQMPDMSGPDVCRALRDDPTFDPTVPIIITTAGPSGRAERLRAFEAGAWEFFGQPIDGDTLLAKLRVFLRVRRTARNLRAQLLVNGDTGLYTESGLARRGLEIAAEARREGQPVACVVLRPALAGSNGDGGDIPEAVTGQVIDLFRRVGRRADAFGHLGAGGFGMIAPRTPERGVRRLVARFEQALQERLAVGGAHRASLRAGFCVLDRVGADEPDPMEMLHRAGNAARRTSAEMPIQAA